MNFTMARNRTVVSKCGRSIEFVKGAPTHVPPMMYDDVLAAGGVPETELPDPDEGSTRPPDTPEAREPLILAAIKEMVERAQREDFTAAGAPHLKVLSQKVGFTVDSRERDAAWTKFQAPAED